MQCTCLIVYLVLNLLNWKSFSLFRGHVVHYSSTTRMMWQGDFFHVGSLMDLEESLRDPIDRWSNKLTGRLENACCVLVVGLAAVVAGAIAVLVVYHPAVCVVPVRRKQDKTIVGEGIAARTAGQNPLCVLGIIVRRVLQHR